MNRVESKSEKFFSSLSVQTVVTVLLGVLEIVVFSILSRLLSRTDFGYFAVITALVSVFKCFSEAGFGSAIIQKKEHSDAHISTAFSLSILTGLFFSILLFVTASFLARILSVNEIETPLRMMSIILLINSLGSVGNAVLTRKLRFLRIGVIKLTAYTISAVISILLALKGFGLYSIVALHLLNASLCVLFLYTTSVSIPHFKLYKKEVKNVVSFGGWYTGNVFMNSLIVDIDKFVLPKILSVKALGSYSRPTSFITSITSQINSIFDTVLFPMLSGMQDDMARLRNVFKRSISMLNVFSVFLSLGFFINAELIIRVFFGNDWLDLVPIMRILAISVIFNVDGRLVDCFFRSIGEVKLAFEIRIFAFIITLISVIVGSWFGVIGVAIGAVSSNVLVILVKMSFIVKRISISIVDVLIVVIKSFLPSIPIIMVGCIYFFVNTQTVLFQIFVLILYVVILCVEMLFFPKYIGEEYYNVVYPKIKKIVHKKNEK